MSSCWLVTEPALEFGFESRNASPLTWENLHCISMGAKVILSNTTNTTDSRDCRSNILLSSWFTWKVVWLREEEVGVTEELCQFFHTRRGWLRDKKDDVFPGDPKRKTLLLASFKKECQFCSLEFCCFLSSCFLRTGKTSLLLPTTQAFKYRCISSMLHNACTWSSKSRLFICWRQQT